MGRNPGFTLVELLVVVAVLATLAGVGTGFQGEMVARMEVEAATRRVLQGLERGRYRAERQAQPCALSLQPGGWAAPTSGTLPSCFEAEEEPPEGLRGRGGCSWSTTCRRRCASAATGWCWMVARWCSPMAPPP